VIFIEFVAIPWGGYELFHRFHSSFYHYFVDNGMMKSCKGNPIAWNSLNCFNVNCGLPSDQSLSGIAVQQRDCLRTWIKWKAVVL